MIRYTRSLVIASAVLMLPVMLQAEDKQPDASVKVEARKIVGETAIPLRASALVGMNVRNGENKVIGSISDFVVDLKDQRIRYLAVSYGGFLGLGDKLFAVPTDAFELRRHADADTHYLVLDIPEDRLKNAPGFDQNNWPDFAETKWQKAVDEYYRTSDDRVIEKAPITK